MTKILARLILPAMPLLLCSFGTESTNSVPTRRAGEAAETPLPAPNSNKVVAHRGGAKEAGASVPDNSIAALDYALSLGCYASECDIYYTADRRVIVAHADSEGKVNGLYPCDATLDELRAAGTLANGEELPTLEDYIGHVIKEGSCTRLWLDIKNVTQPSALPACSIGACEAACKIIKDMNAQQWVEFICTGNETVMKGCAPVARRNGISIAWMSTRPAKEYVSRGYTWANLNVSSMADATHSGNLTIDEFKDAGVVLSVYNVDKEANMRFYAENCNKMKAICSNYPAQLIEVVEDVTGGVAAAVADSGDDTASPVYYNLQGVRIDNPREGLYIMVRGGNVTKEIVR